MAMDRRAVTWVGRTGSRSVPYGFACDFSRRTPVVTEHERMSNHCPKTTSSASVHDMVTGSCIPACSAVLAAQSNAPENVSLSARRGRRKH